MRREQAIAVGLGALGALGAMTASRLWRASQALDFAGASVLIIGGSRGLGLVLARLLADEGARVTLAARDLEELERARTDLEARGANVNIVVCDVRQQADVDAAVAAVVRDRGGLDVLMNVAGIIQVGPAEHMSAADFEDALRTHFWGPFYATRAAEPHLRQSRAARIVNISSIGGRIAVPHLLPYSASKFALTGFSEGLRTELAPFGIHVTTVSPGLMRTGSTYNAWFKGKHRREFAWFHTADSLPLLSIDVVRAARQIIEACRRGDAELTITLPARLAVLMKALCPETTAKLLTLTNRLLPAAGDAAGRKSRSGWQSVSRLAPSVLTRSADRATTENNEVPPTVEAPFPV
jgi:NAD(P)-dependent dehydrogenase (short-subunit alcohol dehydrogenase family)